MGRNQDGQICAVQACYNYGIQKHARSMFRFPKDSDLCKKWISAVHRVDLEKILESKGSEGLYKSYRICSDHFEQNCFRNPRQLSQGLIKGALPTLLLGLHQNPESLQVNNRVSPESNTCPRFRSSDNVISTNKSSYYDHRFIARIKNGFGYATENGGLKTVESWCNTETIAPALTTDEFCEDQSREYTSWAMEHLEVCYGDSCGMKDEPKRVRDDVILTGGRQQCYNSVPKLSHSIVDKLGNSKGNFKVNAVPVIKTEPND